ncbi:hypothetical protein SARC_00282 [Sphaeroforma arctica JP610]|uniref:Uncharacterized protein n=1 Tax=Sphaeroforma arctica JP610 TaxID=667725 RepID=A0A0L0GEY7_9EUKA|nr:hypothetical protein SARC_00282 [Sphaeroforma arctica JP610]KNC87580.1 hypothetical protein SARC_00282 [Sphaeroforma arctica JP610]|eukprot:XP_014161482.1 hypothetical protein SARC_00282 [Sphaeroforma arctica JP610]
MNWCSAMSLLQGERVYKSSQQFGSTPPPAELQNAEVQTYSVIRSQNSFVLMFATADLFSYTVRPILHWNTDEEVEVDKIPDYESTSQSSVKDRYEAVAKTPDRGAKCLAQLSSISKNIESKTSSSLSLKVFVAESSKGEALKTRDKFALLTNIVKLAGSEATKSPSSRCETQSKKEKLLDSCVTGDSLAVDDGMCFNAMQYVKLCTGADVGMCDQLSYYIMMGEGARFDSNASFAG